MSASWLPGSTPFESVFTRPRPVADIGHRQNELYEVIFRHSNVLTCVWSESVSLRLAGGHIEASRFYCVVRRRGGLASNGGSTAGRADAPYRRAPARIRGRSGNAGPHCSVSSGP